ncbi:replicative DNA helicase [Pseudoxanthomonas sp. LjRoot168]|uniref:replicative DNA helicase n=1 Tax=unclassified Pseudoxanthomonas TaxID=2645906 RepID=UPI003ECEF8B3
MTSGRDPKRDAASAATHAQLVQLKVPPHSIEAEQAVLGGLMLAQEMFDVVSEKLEGRDFYRRDHQLIWQAMAQLAEETSPFDAVTLGEWFVNQGASELVGGGAYLVELASTTPSAANIEAYADIVREKALLRRLIDEGTQIVNAAFNPGHREAQEIVSEAEQRVFSVGQDARDVDREATTASSTLKKVFETLRVQSERGGGITGLPTGYVDLDELTAGLHPTDLIILAARPAMGKTTLAVNIAEYTAITSKKAVAVFSMEMSSEQLTQRMVSSQGRVHATRLRRAQLEDQDWAHVTAAIRIIQNASPILIDDTPGLSPERLRSKARRLKREHPDLSLIVIDYLQLMAVPGNSENRATEVSAITRALKGLAKELNVPIIALSQLNRSLETRSDKRPVMADLRESGAIEQDADMIVFIYRDDYYNKENSPDKGLAEIIIGKQRHGPTDTCKLRFLGEYNRFENLKPAALDDDFMPQGR